MRATSLKFVPTAILSRQTAGIRGRALIVNLPGQPKSIRETLEGLKDADGKAIPCTFQYQRSDTNPTGGVTDCQKMEDQGYKMLPDSCKNNGSGTYVAQRPIVVKGGKAVLARPVENLNKLGI